jgi:HAD superfamily hydrolase (TIGR01509 family)
VRVAAQLTRSRLRFLCYMNHELVSPLLIPRRVGAVIFDCDGTLIDSELINAKALQSVLEPQGLHIPIETLQQRFTGIDNKSILRQLNDESGVRLSLDFEMQIESATYEISASLAKPMPWANQVVAALAEAGTVLTVASNSSYRNVEMMLKQAGLIEFFESRIATRDRVAAPKPAPDVFILAAKLSNASPADCVAIEDSPAGVAAACIAGMTVIGYRPPESLFTSTELKGAGASFVIGDLRLLVDGVTI